MIPILQHTMSVLYVYYTVLYQEISGLRHQYNTYSTNITCKTRAPLHGSVSYQPKSDSDPALKGAWNSYIGLHWAFWGIIPQGIFVRLATVYIHAKCGQST